MVSRVIEQEKKLYLKSEDPQGRREGLAAVIQETAGLPPHPPATQQIPESRAQSLGQDQKNDTVQALPLCADGETEARSNLPHVLQMWGPQSEALSFGLGSPRPRQPSPTWQPPPTRVPWRLSPPLVLLQLNPRARPATSVERHCHLVAVRGAAGLA